MIDIKRIPDDVIIKTSEGNTGLYDSDIKIDFETAEKGLKLYITAKEKHPEFIVLRWNCRTEKPVRVFGDKWERAYADLSWTGIDPEAFMPWYFFVNDGKETGGCGVMVQSNSFVSFEYDAQGVSAWVDVRCGADGVRLNGRRLHAATFVCRHYKGISAFEAAEQFCNVLSPSPILPKTPVYGSNNWYYAYGKSTRGEILEDARLLAELTDENENRPYMVIDDGWTSNSTNGPWFPGEHYGDMKTLADEFRKMGVRPGIWVRLLHDSEFEEKNPQAVIIRNGHTCAIDPSHPDGREYIKEVLLRIKAWGYELLKHDFSTFDMFGSYGFSLNGSITNTDGWSFYDKSKTSAEIVLDFYRLIRETVGDMIVIGCNTVSHLCAGLVEINRTGDDTSGYSWTRTRALGINTLAFRMPQNRSFYMCDADCVGLLEENIPWKLNRRWLDLLCKSGTPLFVSCQPSAVTEEMKKDLRAAYKAASIQCNKAVPLDWEYNKNPAYWSIDGEYIRYDWVDDSYPVLLKGRVPGFGDKL